MSKRLLLIIFFGLATNALNVRNNNNNNNTYDEGDLHILYVRAIELQQAIETDIYL